MRSNRTGGEEGGERSVRTTSEGIAPSKGTEGMERHYSLNRVGKLSM